MIYKLLLLSYTESFTLWKNLLRNTTEEQRTALLDAKKKFAKRNFKINWILLWQNKIITVLKNTIRFQKCWARMEEFPALSVVAWNSSEDFQSFVQAL